MIPPFRYPSIDPRRRAPQGEWTPEGSEEAIARMPRFARGFFDRLLAEFPCLKNEVLFLRWSSQPDDIYAFFDRSPGFVVQIDPDLEYVIVSEGGGSSEYGDWGHNDRNQDAIDHIRGILIGKP